MKKLLGIVNSKDILVLDQFVTDRERDFSKKLDYVDNLKVILVYRDPRDVFATSHVFGTACHWIPKDVENFISWYTQSTLEQLAVSDNHLLSVRFEDFINEYDNVSEKIMVFLNLDRKDHVSPKSVFNPELSAKNIGLYKSIDRVGDMKKIEKVLGDYCYDTKGSSV